MAQRKPVVIDGEVRHVSNLAVLEHVVRRDVTSVVTQSGDLIACERFSQVPVSAGFATYLAAINKGAAGDMPGRPERVHPAARAGAR